MPVTCRYSCWRDAMSEPQTGSFFACCASCQIPTLQLPWSNGRQRHVPTSDGGVDVSVDQRRSYEGTDTTLNKFTRIRFLLLVRTVFNPSEKCMRLLQWHPWWHQIESCEDTKFVIKTNITSQHVPILYLTCSTKCSHHDTVLYMHSRFTYSALFVCMIGGKPIPLLHSPPFPFVDMPSPFFLFQFLIHMCHNDPRYIIFKVVIL